VRRPELIQEAASRFGNQCVVLAIDGKKMKDGSYHVFLNGGRIDSGIDVVQWAKDAERLGAGEILLTSMDADGTKNGFDHDMLNAVCNAVNVPVIASGGCGTVGHFVKLFEETNADAALAASIFHYGDLTVQEVKTILDRKGISVRRTDDLLLGRDLSIYFVKSQLIPGIIQDARTKEVLMMAYLSRESLQKTIDTGYTWFYSRSRQELWNKGATSGHYQKVISITPDCDRDTLLIQVDQTGVACHTGHHSCFYRKGELTPNG
jgi:cyclase